MGIEFKKAKESPPLGPKFRSKVPRLKRFDSIYNETSPFRCGELEEAHHSQSVHKDSDLALLLFLALALRDGEVDVHLPYESAEFLQDLDDFFLLRNKALTDLFFITARHDTAATDSLCNILLKSA
jgi:hypothetical protein